MGFMLHRIRYTLKPETLEKFRGVVEADETYIGGLEKNKHKDKKLNKGRGAVVKTLVMGLLECGDEEKASQVWRTVIPNNSKASLHGQNYSPTHGKATMSLRRTTGGSSLTMPFNMLLGGYTRTG